MMPTRSSSRTRTTTASFFWNRAKDQVERIRIEGEKTPAGVSVEAKDVAGARKMNLRLPNTIPTADARVNRTNPEVKIVLPEMYKLNAEGPSYAHLFEGAPPKESLKQEWKAEELQKSLVLKLKDLKADQPYVLQRTFYYCIDAKNAVCEIASIQQKIQIDPSGADTIEIALQKK